MSPPSPRPPWPPQAGPARGGGGGPCLGRLPPPPALPVPPPLRFHLPPSFPLSSLPFPPPFSPFPFLPSLVRPLLFHLSFLPAPRGAPCLGLVGGHRRRRGRGPCGLPSPPAPATPPSAGASPPCHPILGPRGSPALRPTRIRECLQGAGWAWAWKAGLTAGWWGAHIPPIAPSGRHPPPPRACPAPSISPRPSPSAFPHPFFSLHSSAMPPSPPAAGLLRVWFGSDLRSHSASGTPGWSPPLLSSLGPR